MSRVQVSGSLVLCLAIVAAGSAQQPGEEKKYDKDLYFDFRGKPLSEDLTLVGAAAEGLVHAEPQGLRITVPAERTGGPVGVATRFRVQGDFEITATVEILQADVPEKGFGVGATLTLQKVEPPTEGTNIGRLSRPSGEKIMWDRRYDKPGEKPTFAGNSKPCTDKLVRMRLERTGDELAYLWAVGAEGGEFQNLHKAHFGADAVKQVLLRARTEGPHNVDVRLIDLRIRSGGMVPASDVAVDEGKAEATPPPGQGSWPWLLAGLLALMITIGVALVLGLRRRRAADAALAPASQSVSFECSGCRTTLKVKAKFTGKEIKCPQCGITLVVPSTPA